ncbi:MAG: nitroreductase family protein [Patescibacteria group bacterium]
MELFEVVKKRRSVRKWKDKPIPRAYLEKLTEAIIWAPSAGNLESRKFYFVFREDLRLALAESARQPFVSKAPMIAVACADRDKSAWKYGEIGKNLYCVLDACLSAQNLMLAAADLGLGAVPIGVLNPRQVADILNLPKDMDPILIIPVGFPAEFPEPPTRTSYGQAAIEIK